MLFGENLPLSHLLKTEKKGIRSGLLFGVFVLGLVSVLNSRSLPRKVNLKGGSLTVYIRKLRCFTSPHILLLWESRPSYPRMHSITMEWREQRESCETTMVSTQSLSPAVVLPFRPD